MDCGRFNFIVLAIILFVSLVPSARATNGKAVLDVCETAKKQNDRELMLVCKTSILVAFESYNLGVNETIDDLKLFDFLPKQFSAEQLKRVMNSYCVGESVNGNAVVEIVIEHLRNNQNQYDLPIATVVRSALTRAFPCSNE